LFFFSSRRRHTRFSRDWSSDVCSSDLQQQQVGTLIKEEVTYEDIAEVVAKWTGIPVTKLVQGEREKLLRLEDVLHKRVIGQEERSEERRVGKESRWRETPNERETEDTS